jgi:hypothetical protein
VLAFNPGVIYRVISITPHGDFTAGEIDQPDRMTFCRNADGKQDGTQIQVLSYLGKTWGMGEPRFTAEQVVDFSRNIKRRIFVRLEFRLDLFYEIIPLRTAYRIRSGTVCRFSFCRM